MITFDLHGLVFNSLCFTAFYPLTKLSVYCLLTAASPCNIWLMLQLNSHFSHHVCILRLKEMVVCLLEDMRLMGRYVQTSTISSHYRTNIWHPYWLEGEPSPFFNVRQYCFIHVLIAIYHMKNHEKPMKSTMSELLDHKYEWSRVYCCDIQ